MTDFNSNLYEKCFPLSFAQERLWLIQQITPDSLAYNVSLGIRLTGPLNIHALEAALSHVVRRHEVLRTVIIEKMGAPLQAVLPARDIRLEIVAASSGDEMVLGDLATEEVRKPFNLSKGPLFRCKLLHVSEQEHVLVITMHHIVTDGWSRNIIREELETLYETYLNHSPADLPTLPVQYGDFATWQRNKLPESVYESSLSYWKRKLRDAPSRLNLPTDHPLPSEQSHQGMRYSIHLDSELISSLKSVGQQSSATLFMTLFAAYTVLISRYTNSDDIVVGSPIAGRTRVEIERQVGFFVNLIALRTDISGDPSFCDLLCRVRKTATEAYTHQDVPFEKIVNEVVSDRDLNVTPLFQTLFQMKNYPRPKRQCATLLFNEFEIKLGASQYNLAFDLEMTHEGVVCHCDFATDLFDHATIKRMVGHFVTLLEGIVADTDQPISELPLLTEPERHQLLVEWNDTATDYPQDKCIHQLFEEQVERNPDAIAVIFEDQELTYRELNARANQLANYLRTLGVGPETLVGLCLDRSPELIVGILGILKAGGAYVPLDADLPPQRLEFMLQDAAVEYLVTQHALLERLPAIDCQVVCLDSDAASLQGTDQSNPAVDVGADNLAYVMYTSGSTGQPKGVTIRHNSVARLVFGNDYMAFGPDRVFLQLATVSFDASALELWGSLLHGAKLVIAPVGLPDFQQLEVLLNKNRVTTLWLTATLFNQIAENYPQALSGVDEILTGGEALSVRHICKMQSALGTRLRLINGYGPTESTTFTTCYRMPPSVTSELESIPIGRPIANTQVYVLDAQCHPTPIGIPGELYIGGAGLAREYLNRPELTAEKFVTNPFDDDSNSRLYRTGDLCRWRADGNLEFLGRLDDQVKLRGFRIELGEIETVLTDHSDVAQGVVVLREDRPGDKRLVAYCIPAADAVLNVSELRSHLQDRLPDYMVPSAFVDLDTLPLTSSGKINRRVLPEPDDSRPELETGYVAPRNPIEQQIAAIWSEVLGIENVGIHDNYFELGGHSLLAVRLFAQIEKSFGRKLPLSVLFQNGTVRHLADLLVEPGPANDIATVVPLQPDGDGRPLFLMPGIVGGMSLSRAVIEKLSGRFPVFGIQMPLATQNLEQFREFRATAGHLVSALRTYQPHGPYALAGYSYGGMMAYEVACVLTELGEEVDLLAVIDTGPGQRGRKPQLGDHMKRLSRIVTNLPFWLREEWRQFSARRFAGRVVQKLRQFYRQAVSGGRARVELDDVFDVKRFPSQNQELMHVAFSAFRDYLPRPYTGRLTLLRAKTQPLLNGLPLDLGWERYVTMLETHQIGGDHESILRPPHADELAKQLDKLLSDLPQYTPSEDD